MACCASLPYFMTAEREQYSVASDSDDLFMYDCKDDDIVLTKCLALFTDSHHLSDDDRLVSVSVSTRGGSDDDTCAGGALLNDCMWSAGMLPPDLKAASPSNDCLSASQTSVEDSDVDAAVVCTAVDPSLVSPCPHVTSLSPGARHVTSPPPCADLELKEMKSSSDESGDEVDVVSVPTSPQLSHSHDLHTSPNARLDQLSSASRGLVVRDLLVLPRACSLLARVTAMHNYSSCTTTSSSSLGAGMYSAPQSPDTDPAQHRLDRGCFSTPTSPLHSPSATTTAAKTVRRSRRRVAYRRRRPTTTPTSNRAAAEFSGSDDSDSGYLADHPAPGGGKRAHHNVLERRRRDNLKYNFEALRAAVPGSPSDGRIPKVVILRRARDHVRHLTTTAQKLYAEYSRLRCLNQRWTYKLALLTANSGRHSPQHNLCTSVVEAAA